MRVGEVKLNLTVPDEECSYWTLLLANKFAVSRMHQMHFYSKFLAKCKNHVPAIHHRAPLPGEEVVICQATSTTPLSRQLWDGTKQKCKCLLHPPQFFIAPIALYHVISPSLSSFIAHPEQHNTMSGRFRVFSTKEAHFAAES